MPAMMEYSWSGIRLRFRADQQDGEALEEMADGLSLQLPHVPSQRTSQHPQLPNRYLVLYLFTFMPFQNKPRE